MAQKRDCREEIISTQCEAAQEYYRQVDRWEQEALKQHCPVKVGVQAPLQREAGACHEPAAVPQAEPSATANAPGQRPLALETIAPLMFLLKDGAPPALG